MNKQCPLQNRGARRLLIPDELGITLHLQNDSLKILTLKYINFTPPSYIPLETQVRHFGSIATAVNSTKIYDQSVQPMVTDIQHCSRVAHEMGRGAAFARQKHHAGTP